MSAFIPSKKTFMLALVYVALIIAYGIYIILGVDLFTGTTIIANEMNRDPLSGAVWMLFMLILTPLVGLITNVVIDGDES